MARNMLLIFAMVVAARLFRRGVESQSNTSVEMTSSSNQTVTTATVQMTQSLTQSLVQLSTSVLASNSSLDSAVVQPTNVQPSQTQAPTPSSTVSTPTVPSTSGPTVKTAVWDKAIDLATPLGTFIIVIVAVALVIILLIAFIWICCKYRNLKKRTKFPSQMAINDAEHRWIQSSEDLMMWERNLRASEVASNGRSLSDRPYNEKRK